MKIWIDSTACESRFHTLESADDGWEVWHVDDSLCEDVEFQVVEDGDDDWTSRIDRL